MQVSNCIRTMVIIYIVPQFLKNLEELKLKIKNAVNAMTPDIEFICNMIVQFFFFFNTVCHF